jgi:hypothetical protein
LALFCCILKTCGLVAFLGLSLGTLCCMLVAATFFLCVCFFFVVVASIFGFSF